MRMYCYTYAIDAILKNGYLSAANNPDAKQLWVYRSHAGSEDKKDIEAYLESTFEGRLRSICCVTMPAPVQKYKHPYLNYIVHHAGLISFDLEELIRDNLVEAIYCKDDREAIKQAVYNENIYKLNDILDIDTRPIEWEKADCVEFSPYSQIKHYIIVLTKGYIPPQYIKVEKTQDVE